MAYNILYIEKSPMTQMGVKILIERNASFNIVLSIQSKFSMNKVNCKNTDVFMFNTACVTENDLKIFLLHKDKALQNGKKIIAILNDFQHTDYSKILLKEMNGILHVNSDPKEIIYCIEEVKKGNKYISKFIKSNWFCETDNLFDNLKKLTPKEQKVLELIIQGKSTSEISDILFNSIRTIDAHRRNIAVKLDLQGPGKLSRFLISNKKRILLQISISKSNKLITSIV